MSNLLSRLAVAAVGVPIVLGCVYLGGWWLFGLLVVAAVVSLHEYWLLARRAAAARRSPGTSAALLALLGAERGGIELDARRRAQRLRARVRAQGRSAETRQAPTASISATVMGAVWIGCGLAFVLLLRGLPEHGRLAASRCCSRSGRATRSPTPAGARSGVTAWPRTHRPGKTWEGFAFGAAATVFVAFVALYKAALPERLGVARRSAA